ncbi:MAG: cysteine desulfurase NifS [Deltaproteobacteria bacterium]|nr:MAG: cysteine desulfurase NifS [Deltaproteobacteria bacterium]
MLVYLDNNATTMVAPEVFEAMKPFFSEMYGNPSSMHHFGGQVAEHVQRAREQVARLLGAKAEEIIFTAGGSEGDNLAIKGVLEALGGEKRHIVTTRVEHPAVRVTCRWLRDHGFRLTEIPVDRDGTLDMDALEKALTPDTAIVSVMWANNETGVIFPIEQIANMVNSRGILFHTDAVQAAGKIPIDVGKVPVDLLTISGHKLHAPKGIGALYVRKGTKLTPQIHGGHQEQGKRAGTENVPGIVGLGKAAELALETMDEENDRVRKLRDKLERGLLEKCEGAAVNGRNRLPNTLNISFEYIEGESILLMLSDLGVCASSGSACSSGSLEPSHVLRAMGVPFTLAHGSVRFSLSRYNTEEEIDYVIEHMPGIVKKLREISPFVGGQAWAGKPTCPA